MRTGTPEIKFEKNHGGTPAYRRKEECGRKNCITELWHLKL
jgi:hypothetical protein